MDTLLPTQMFPRLPARAAFVADTNFVSGTQKMFDFVQKHFVSATNVSQFAQPKKHHGQQCVRNNVSSFTRAFSYVGWAHALHIVNLLIKIPRMVKYWRACCKGSGFYFDYCACSNCDYSPKMLVKHCVHFATRACGENK